MPRSNSLGRPQHAYDTVMRRSYVDTSQGQVHVRSAGDGERTLLLVHWTPLSGRMFEGVARLFVDAGFRVIAPDLLGYGRSDARPADWSIAAWANNLAEVLDELSAQSVVALGGHNGASVVVELALGHPDRVDAVVLDGCPILTPSLRAAFSALTASRPPASPQEVLDRTIGLLTEYIPGYQPTGDSLALLWPALTDYLATDFVSSAAVAARYDIAERLPKLEQPALLLGSEFDPLGATFDEAMTFLRPAQHQMFPGNHPLHFPERHREYADIVIGFLKP